MAIFGILDLDDIIQVNEKTRIDCTGTFFTPDEGEVTVVEVEPYSGAGFIDITPNVVTDAKNYYLDYLYSTDGTKTVSLRITTDGSPVMFTKTISVVTVVDDALFSNDSRLKEIEPDIMKWLPKGKTTWNFVHRSVQNKILNELYKSRVFTVDGNKLTKDEVINTSEVMEWATYYALFMIFYSLSNSADDVFSVKSKEYEVKKNQFMNYSMNVLQLDYNVDGELTSGERYDIRSIGMIRR